MTKKLITSVVAGVALLTTPVLAQSGMAERAAAALSQQEGFGGSTDRDDEGGGLILGVVAAALIIAGIGVALSGGDDDLPASP